jgi:hypothetical protein
LEVRFEREEGRRNGSFSVAEESEPRGSETGMSDGEWRLFDSHLLRKIHRKCRDFRPGIFSPLLQLQKRIKVVHRRSTEILIGTEMILYLGKSVEK